MRRFLVLGVLAAGLLGAGFIQPVQAQEECTPVDSFSVPGDVSTYTSGTYETLTDHTYLVIVSGLIQFGSSEDSLTDPQYLTLDGTFGDLIRQNQVQFSTSDAPDADDDTYNPEHEYTFTRSGNGSPIGLRFFDTEYGDNSLSWDVEVQECGGGGGFGWIRPLLQADEYVERPLYDYDDAFHVVFGDDAIPEPSTLLAAVPALHRVYADSSEAGAPVMVATSGTVTDVSFADPSMCSVWGALLASQQCWFVGPRVEANLFPLYSFDIDTTIQLVTVTLDDGSELRYMVQNADNYVTINQEVEAGCVIGETIQAKQTKIAEYGAEFAKIAETISLGFLNLIMSHGEQPDFAVAMIEYHDTPDTGPIELLDRLTEYNQDAVPCNISPNFRDCLLSDPDLKHGAKSWTLFGGADASDAGVHLVSDSYMRQVVNLPDESTFTLRLGVNYDVLGLLGGGSPIDQTLFIRVGSFTDTLTVPFSDQYQELTLEIPTPDPDPGGLGYTVQISNTSPSGAVYVQAACLSSDDHELNPRACYFANPDFDSTEGWITTSSQLGNGFIILGDADAVSQAVTLQPNDDDSPRTYHLEVDVRPIAAPGATFNPNIGTATMYYSWDEIGTIGALDLTWNQPGEPGFPDAFETLSINIEVSEPTTADFIIYTGIEDNTTMRIALSRACISTDDLPDGGGVGGPFKTTCSTIPVPTDDSFGAWILYHWRNSDKFFNCRLMVLLNKWFKLFDEFRRTTLLFLRWTIALVHKGADWSVTVFWWLNGSFRNIATGNVTTVLGDNQCHDLICLIAGIFNPGGTNIFDVLLAAINGLLSIAGQIIGLLLALITQAANVLLTVIVGSIVFVIKIVGQILALLKLGQALLASLISAYNNATPIPIPFMPTCVSDPQSSGFCVFFWVADNTIFSGPGVVIVPLLVAIGSIHLIIWVASEIRNTVLSVGSTS